MFCYLVYLFKVQPIGELKVLPFLSSYHYFVIPRWLWSRPRDLCLNLTWDRFLNQHLGPYHRLIFLLQRPDPSTSSSGSGCFWILQRIFVVSMHPLEKGILWKWNMWIVKQKSSCLREFIAVQPESVCGNHWDMMHWSVIIWSKLKSTFMCMWYLFFVWSSIIKNMQQIIVKHAITFSSRDCMVTSPYKANFTSAYHISVWSIGM